jgi:Family of unknown function (DUF6152)
MKRKFEMLLILIVVVLGPCRPLVAHRGLSAYDERNPVTFKGIVTEFAWFNPHSQIHFRREGR